MSEESFDLELDEEELLALLDEADEAAVPAPAPVIVDEKAHEPDHANIEADVDEAPADPAPAPVVPPSIPITGLPKSPPFVPAEDESAKGRSVYSGPSALVYSGPSALNFHIDVEAFKASISVTETNLDDQMLRQAGDRAYYAAQAAKAESQAARLEARFKVIEARLYDKHRKAMASSSEKVTEKMVENAVLLDPEWLVAKNTVIEAETIANIHRYAIVKALDDRRDMMIQLGADRRGERAGQLRMTAISSDNSGMNEDTKSAIRSAINNRPR